ncbi:MAG: sigma-54 dependent transcriptional regulator [Desulfobacteraceae bacterium]|nr:sigma-54 dependent transcriptional regulator [Desulfobacteraceae bacterium]
MPKVLIVDDDHAVCRTLATLIRQQGHEVISAQSIGQGLKEMGAGTIDLVLLDVNLPDGNGLEQIDQFAQASSKPDIIIMTAQGDPDGAELAIRSGAWDYIEKSASPKTVTLRIQRILEHRAVKCASQPALAIDRKGIVGNSQPLQRALDQMARAANSEAGVLITGETGTGKELFALAVHRNSSRKEHNFVVVDCAALPKSLVESILFGHIKGAFTGADSPREGLVSQADGGTLFLDEVGEMPLDVQKSFLRVLESRSFRPIGGKHEQSSNFRVIASTNQDLDEMARNGAFRADLLHRLRTFHLILPALRQRCEDIADLAQHHLKRLCTLYGRRAKELSPDFLNLLRAHDWPGNVRELVNAMEHAMAAAPHETILYDHHLPAYLRARAARNRLTHPVPKAMPVLGEIAVNGQLPPLQAFREQIMEKAEADYLGALMSAARGNIHKACTLSGVSRSRLYELLKKHAIGS